jgi:hypothetical protein
LKPKSRKRLLQKILPTSCRRRHEMGIQLDYASIRSPASHAAADAFYSEFRKFTKSCLSCADRLMLNLLL